MNRVVNNSDLVVEDVLEGWLLVHEDNARVVQRVNAPETGKVGVITGVAPVRASSADITTVAATPIRPAKASNMHSEPVKARVVHGSSVLTASAGNLVRDMIAVIVENR